MARSFVILRSSVIDIVVDWKVRALP